MKMKWKRGGEKAESPGKEGKIPVITWSLPSFVPEIGQGRGQRTQEMEDSGRNVYGQLLCEFRARDQLLNLWVYGFQEGCAGVLCDLRRGRIKIKFTTFEDTWIRKLARKNNPE